MYTDTVIYFIVHNKMSITWDEIAIYKHLHGSIHNNKFIYELPAYRIN